MCACRASTRPKFKSSLVIYRSRSGLHQHHYEFCVGCCKGFSLASRSSLHATPVCDGHSSCGSFLNEIIVRIATRLFGHLETATRRAMKHLGPMLQHRLDMDDKYGRDWPNADRPVRPQIIRNACINCDPERPY